MSQLGRIEKEGVAGAETTTSVFQETDPEILFDRPTKQRPPHEILRYGITEAILDGEKALFEVLPGVGKSRSVTSIAKGLKAPITILTNLRDNYSQYSDWGDEDGVDVHKLPRSDLCPTLQGNYLNDEVAQRAREAHRDGWPVSMIHRELDLPCDRGEDKCPYRKKVEEIDPSEPDPLVGHFTQGYNSPYVNDRVVVIDEDAFSHYITQIKKPVEKANEFLETLDDFSFESARRPEPGEESKRKQALSRLEKEGLDPAEHQDSVGEFHAKAPVAAYTIFAAERMENDWVVADVPQSRTATFYGQPGNRGTDNDTIGGSIHLFDPPDLSGAEVVIGLDATPSLSKWKAIIGDDLDHYRLFDDHQRNRYLREEGYEFIQLNDYVWPVSGRNVSIDRSEAYLREVYREHGRRPDLVTSRALLGRKEDREGLEDRNLSHLWDRDMHYGNLRSRNKLEDSELLVVLGSPSRRDGDIQLPAALLGECAIPTEDENGDRLTGYNLDYQSEVANKILENSRRGGVFQAAMRAGRKEDTEATIYIATGMVPDWLDTKKVGRRSSTPHHDACTKLRSDGEKQVIKALRGADGMSPGELYEQVDLSKDRAKKHRQVLQERGLVQKKGERRWSKYSDKGLDSLNIAGSVNLSLSVCSPFNNSIRGGTPIESRPEQIIPRGRQPTDPLHRYPDWMRVLQHRAVKRWIAENQRRSKI